MNNNSRNGLPSSQKCLSIYTPLTEFASPLQSMTDDISTDEWHQIVASLSNNSAAGPLHIPYRILKKLPESFICHLLRFINICYNNSLVPSAWKTSNIAPIPKPQSFNYMMENTRPAYSTTWHHTQNHHQNSYESFK